MNFAAQVEKWIKTNLDVLACAGVTLKFGRDNLEDAYFINFDSESLLAQVFVFSDCYVTFDGGFVDRHEEVNLTLDRELSIEENLDIIKDYLIQNT